MKGDTRRVRTFYGSALSEALHAKNVSRFCYQGLFYLFEWVSAFRRGTIVGISKASAHALPLIQSVIPCGVPLDSYKPAGNKTANPSILFLGDLDSRKQGNYLLSTFTNDIIKKYPDCMLSVVGPQPCTGPNIHYAGNLPEADLITAYQRAWVYCMPSSYEGFGVPAIEAMACGTAVVSINNPGIKEIIRHNHNGLLVDGTQLSSGIGRVLADTSLRESLENRGRNTVENQFNIDTVAEEYEKLYRSLTVQK